MMYIPLIAATDPDFAHSHSVMDALPHLGGMIMVLVTLFILWGLTVLISKVVAIIQSKAPAAAPVAPPAEQKTAPATAPPAAAVPDTGIAPELVAVIAAAVTAYTGKPQRIVSIKPISTSWERAGRQSVLTSHRIR